MSIGTVVQQTRRYFCISTATCQYSRTSHNLVLQRHQLYPVRLSSNKAILADSNYVESLTSAPIGSHIHRPYFTTQFLFAAPTHPVLCYHTAMCMHPTIYQEWPSGFLERHGVCSTILRLCLETASANAKILRLHKSHHCISTGLQDDDRNDHLTTTSSAHITFSSDDAIPARIAASHSPEVLIPVDWDASPTETDNHTPCFVRPIHPI